MALEMHGALAMHPGEWLKSEMIEMALGVKADPLMRMQVTWDRAPAPACGPEHVKRLVAA